MDYTTRIKKGNFIRITLQDTSHKYGFFLDDKDGYLTMLVDSDFMIDGYMLISKNTIKSIRNGIQEKFYERLYKINTIKIPSRSIANDIKSVAHTCMKNQEPVIIETFKRKEYSFDLCMIKNITDIYCVVKPISSLGKFKTEKKIYRGNIDLLSRGNMYTKVFQTHIMKR